MHPTGPSLTLGELLIEDRQSLRPILAHGFDERDMGAALLPAPATEADAPLVLLPGGKVRDELETVIGDGGLLLRVFEELGFHVWFRYEKYRQEFTHENVIVAIDETPVGVFVEIEGCEAGITTMARALGRRPSDYIVDSYRTLFLKHKDEAGLDGTDMVFGRPE